MIIVIKFLINSSSKKSRTMLVMEHSANFTFCHVFQIMALRKFNRLKFKWDKSHFIPNSTQIKAYVDPCDGKINDFLSLIM